MEAQLSTEAFSWGRTPGETELIVPLSFLLLLISRLGCLHVKRRLEFFLSDIQRPSESKGDAFYATLALLALRTWSSDSPKSYFNNSLYIILTLGRVCQSPSSEHTCSHQPSDIITELSHNGQ